MIGVPHEAANVCRWKDLPRPPQPLRLPRRRAHRDPAVLLLGRARDGETLVGREPPHLRRRCRRRDFLDRLTKVIGDKELLRSSTSTSKQGTSVNRQLQRKQILDIAELAALSAGRAIVFVEIACDPDPVHPLDGAAVRRPDPRLPRAERPRRTQPRQLDRIPAGGTVVTLPDTEWDDTSYGDDVD
jgi:hypothetical protein